MTIDYIDGFDDYNGATQIGRYWTYGNGASGSDMVSSSIAFDSSFVTTTSGGRNSSGSFKPNNFRCIIKTLVSQASRAMGMAVKFATFVSSGIMCFGDGATSQLTLTTNADGTLSVKRGAAGGTVLGTSTLALSTSIWYFIEFKATINNTTGSFTVRVNGVDWITGSGLDTQNSANASANQVAIGQTGTITNEYDDFYSEDSGTFQGDCRIETKLPTGNGASSQFTPSTGSNWQNVDENPANDDTDYNSDATAGHIDLYTYPAMTTTTGNVKAVMTLPILRNDAAGTVTAASAYRISSTNYFGANNNVGSTTYNSYPDIQTVSPATSSAWTISEINAAQFGLKRVA